MAGLRRPVVALLAASTVSILTLTACSGGSAPGTTHTAAAPLSAATTGATDSSATAETARTRALAATKALHSYLFTATTIVNGHRVVVQGRAVLPDQLALRFTSATSQEDIVKIGHLTYVRVGTTPWKHTSSATSSASPLAGLLTALTATQDLTLIGTGQLTGQLSVKDATHLGLVAASSTTQPLRVTFGLDRADHVTSFSVTATITSGSRPVAMAQTTQFSHFDQAPAVSAPA